jgi:hypothetical protein
VNLFDATLFTGKPDLTRDGFRKLKLVSRGTLFPSGADPLAIPSDATLTAVLSGVTHLTALDIDHWAQPEPYIKLLSRIHTLYPGLRVGYYDVAPKRDYWRAIRPASDPKYSVWQAENDALRPIAEQADVLFPSLYTFYPDQAGWFRYATSNVIEARRYNKVLYPFLCPFYHPSNPELRGQPIPADYWRIQLDTCLALNVDGIVLWGGFKIPWDPQAPWWLETLSFMAREDDSGAT